MWLYPILAITALLTSMISGMLGTAGGIMLLAVLFSFLTHAETIPIHALVQLVSNSTRLIAFFKNIDVSALARFVTGMLPGVLLGSVVYYRFGTPAGSEPYLKMIVGVYILLATFLPKPANRPGHRSSWAFPMIGFVAGAAALTVGATGPLIAPVFAREGFVKERLVATKAVCQAVMHLAKLPVFLLAGSMGKFSQFDFSRLGLLVVLMAAMVIPGTLLGKRALRYISADQFRFLYRGALVLAALKVLLIDGVWRLV